MNDFLLKVIDDNGIEILDDKQAFGKTHYDSLDKLSKMINISFTTRNRETMALQLADNNGITISGRKKFDNYFQC